MVKLMFAKIQMYQVLALMSIILYNAFKMQQNTYMFTTEIIAHSDDKRNMENIYFFFCNESITPIYLNFPGIFACLSMDVLQQFV